MTFTCVRLRLRTRTGIALLLTAGLLKGDAGGRHAVVRAASRGTSRCRCVKRKSHSLRRSLNSQNMAGPYVVFRQRPGEPSIALQSM